MAKKLNMMITFVAAGTMLLGGAQAQQSPAATTAQPTQPVSGQSTTSAPAKAPVAKKPAAKVAPAFTLKTQKEKASYAVGMSIGTGLHRQGIAVHTV